MAQKFYDCVAAFLRDIIPAMNKTSVFLSASLILLLLSFACGDGEKKPNPFGVESELVTDAGFPAYFAFAPDGRLFYGEHETGNIRVVTSDGQLQAEPFAHVDVLIGTEWGLTGLALDPDFEKNRYVYVFYTALVDVDASIGRPTVTRFTDVDNRGVDPQVIVEDLPETDVAVTQYNANGSIHFGPDGFLYITIGNYDNDDQGPGGKPFPQDLSTPIGKMLRVDKKDGAAAPDNPFVDQPEADPRIFAYGFRDNFDFAFHPQTGQIYGTDNTPFSCEELNLITKGASYGWPFGEFPYSDCQAGGGSKAIHLFASEGTEPEHFLSPPGVTGLAFVSGDVYPLLGDSLLVCERFAGKERTTGLMRRLVLSGDNLDQVLSDDVVVEDCKLGIAVSPDGIVYYGNETEIRRLVPLPVETPKVETPEKETPDKE